jgi:WD40 repeat protein
VQLELVAERWLPESVQAIAAAPHNAELAAIAYGRHLAEPDVAIVGPHLETVLELPRHGVVRALAWSPDGLTLATGGGADWFGDRGTQSASIYLWAVSGGRLIARFGGLFGVRALAFSPDGATILSAGMNGPPSNARPSVDLWEVATGRHIRRFAEEPKSRPYFSDVAFVGTVAAAALSDGSTRAWQLETGFQNEPNLASFWKGLSPDDRLVVNGTGEQVDNHGPYEKTAVEVRDAVSGELLARGKHRTTPYAMAFTADSRSILAGGAEGELRLWRIL